MEGEGTSASGETPTNSPTALVQIGIPSGTNNNLEPSVKKPTPRIGDFHRSVVLRRSLCGALVVLMSYFFVGRNWHDKFQYHPLMMTVGFVGFLPEVVHLSNNFRRCRSMAERQQTLNNHLQFALFMKAVALLGFFAIVWSKVERQKRHFTTWHGLIGLLCIATLTAQVLIGLLYHFRPNPLKKYPNLFPTLRRLHFYLGLTLLVLGVGSMALGLQSNFAVRAVPNVFIRQFFASVTLLAVVYSYLRE